VIGGAAVLSNSVDRVWLADAKPSLFRVGYRRVLYHVIGVAESAGRGLADRGVAIAADRSALARQETVNLGKQIPPPLPGWLFLAIAYHGLHPCARDPRQVLRL
jgi:hypothetical protein